MCFVWISEQTAIIFLCTSGLRTCLTTVEPLLTEFEHFKPLYTKRLLSGCNYETNLKQILFRETDIYAAKTKGSFISGASHQNKSSADCGQTQIGK
jgi:hypothetical protein